MGTATEPGPTGLRLGKNLRTIRDGVSVRELSARMRDLGRPLLPSAISKIENGLRRVDVDELIALAVALDCAPNRLLISPESTSEEITLAAGSIQSPSGLGNIDTTPTSREGWRWARGIAPLDAGILVTEDSDEAEHAAYAAEARRERRFQRENQPDDVPDQTDFAALPVDQRAILDAIREAAIDPIVEARGMGLRWKTISRYLRLQTDQAVYQRALTDQKAQRESKEVGD